MIIGIGTDIIEISRIQKIPHLRSCHRQKGGVAHV